MCRRRRFAALSPTFCSSWPRSFSIRTGPSSTTLQPRSARPAPVLDESVMLLKRFYDEGLAQASYLLGAESAGEALVIDPLRDLEPYQSFAASEELRITRVTEPHIHA